LLITNPDGIGPVALDVDATGNHVLEANEIAQVVPTWGNYSGTPKTLSGVASNFSGPPGPTYTLVDATGNYGTVANGNNVSCTDCYSLSITGTAAGGATMTEFVSGGGGDTKIWNIHVGPTFNDVPPSRLLYRYVETLADKGITSGCLSGLYCPTNPVTRDQMAVFIWASSGRPSPPACTTPTLFNDVPATNPFCRFIEALARTGVVGGCSPGNYCPSSAVTRGQMSAFLLRTRDGNAFVPPDCVGTFTDVPPTYVFCSYIEELQRRGITGGCAPGQYCPNNPVTREQMSKFLTDTFALRLYTP
jgi:hypothetical protein